MEKKNLSSIFSWTNHSQMKMKQYMLSEGRVKRVIRNPQRVEKGIAPNTLASMQKAGSKKHPYEIWTMYVINNSKQKFQNSQLKTQNLGTGKIRVISAWKYPGITQPGDPIPIPPDIFEEIMKTLITQNSKLIAQNSKLKTQNYNLKHETWSMKHQ